MATAKHTVVLNTNAALDAAERVKDVIDSINFELNGLEQRIQSLKNELANINYKIVPFHDEQGDQP